MLACAAVAGAIAAAVAVAVLHAIGPGRRPGRSSALLVLALTGGTVVGIRYGARRCCRALSRRRLLALAIAFTGIALLAAGLVPDVDDACC